LRRSFLRSAPERRCDPFTSTAFLNIVPFLPLPLALTYNRPWLCTEKLRHTLAPPLDRRFLFFPTKNFPDPRYVACDMLCCGWHEQSPADPEESAFLHGTCLQHNPRSLHRPSPGAFCLEKQSGRASKNLSAHTEIFSSPHDLNLRRSPIYPG
jgi:hypothetical protein